MNNETKKNLTPVALVHCQSYDLPELEPAVRNAVDLLGGMEAFVRPGNRVLIKPNLLSAHAPEKRVTTDPAVVGIIIRMVKEAGGKPFIGDSPALASFRRVAAKSGLAKTAEEEKVEIGALSEPTPVSMPDDALYKSIEIARRALEADVIINLPKLKTHSQMLLTLGVKNMFGTIVGQRKAEWHYMAGVDRDTFAALLLSIYRAVQPALTLLDGVWGMEGHGPANGVPRHLKVIGAARDAVALDTAVCDLLGIPLRLFPLYRVAKKSGIGRTDIGRIDFLGNPPRTFSVSDFQVPELDSLGVLPGAFGWFTKRFLVSKPVHRGDACVGCGQCAQICPAEAIQLEDKKIAFDYDQCIRCYCCQEICPEDDIHFKKGWLVRVLNRLNR